MAEDAIQEQLRSLFPSDRVTYGRKIHHLAQPAHEHEDADVAVPVGRKAKDEVETHRLPTVCRNGQALQRS
ncbi:hypothetical protein PI124_g21726 [Phytophthora idaei]|nr:hypothetical protein PI124_g21726 [Phytophthora idaei]